MKTFEYRGFTRDGRSCKGLVEALTPKDAREKLAGQGILAERLLPSGRRLRFSIAARVAAYQELSALLGAGMPLVAALDLIIKSPDTGPASSLLAGVRDRVKEGASLADALGAASRSVTAFERAIIAAAERSASVEPMLARLAGFLEEQMRLRDRVQSALIYPSIVVGVGLCVAVLMLGLLVPRTQQILAGGNVPVPAVTVFVVGAGRAALRGGPLLLVGAVVGVVYLRRRLRSDPAFLVRWDRWVFRVPVVGRGYRLLVNLRFARTFAILLQGGVGVLDALALSGQATGSPWVVDLTEREKESVRHGGKLSDAVRRVPPLAGSLPGWIEIGEAGGGLGPLLDTAGRRYQDAWDRFTSRSLSCLEPLLILIIGAFVLLVTLAVLLPVISLTRAVGG